MSLRPAVLAGAVLSVVLLTGCGVAGTDFRPGAAAEVGDDTISVDEVNEATGDLCTLLKSSPDLIGTGVSGGQLRTATLQGLVLRSVADQMAEQYAVKASPGYLDDVEQTRLQFATLDADVVERALPVYTATSYFVNVITVIGEQELGDTGAEAAEDAALAEGILLAQEWQADNGIETSPAFAKFTIASDQVVTEREDLGVTVSEFATLAGGQSPEYVDSLPESQRCG